MLQHDTYMYLRFLTSTHIFEMQNQGPGLMLLFPQEKAEDVASEHPEGPAEQPQAPQHAEV